MNGRNGTGCLRWNDGANPWFQLYPTTERKVPRKLLDRAGQAGCKVCVLTVDTPVFGNRETAATTLHCLPEIVAEVGGGRCRC